MARRQQRTGCPSVREEQQQEAVAFVPKRSRTPSERMKTDAWAERLGQDSPNNRSPEPTQSEPGGVGPTNPGQAPGRGLSLAERNQSLTGLWITRYSQSVSTAQQDAVCVQVSAECRVLSGRFYVAKTVVAWSYSLISHLGSMLWMAEQQSTVFPYIKRRLVKTCFIVAEKMWAYGTVCSVAVTQWQKSSVVNEIKCEENICRRSCYFLVINNWVKSW